MSGVLERPDFFRTSTEPFKVSFFFRGQRVGEGGVPNYCTFRSTLMTPSKFVSIFNSVTYPNKP